MDIRNFNDLREFKKIKDIMTTVITRECIPLLLNVMDYKVICEVGVAEGDFLYGLGLSKPKRLVGVDVWDRYGTEPYKGPLYDMYSFVFPSNKKWREEVQEWAKSNSFKTDIIVDYSVEAAKQFEDGYFDFVYIDALHDYKSVLADLEAWYPKVRKGGMLSGHDYQYLEKPMKEFNGAFEVEFAVKDFMKKHDIKRNIFLTRGLSYSSWFIIK